MNLLQLFYFIVLMTGSLCATWNCVSPTRLVSLINVPEVVTMGARLPKVLFLGINQDLFGGQIHEQFINCSHCLLLLQIFQPDYVAFMDDS